MRDFKPGEIITKLRENKKVSREPSGLDAVLYIEYMLYKMQLKEPVVRLSLNEGQYFAGCIEADGLRQVYLENEQGATLFMACRNEKEPWEIVVFREGPWKTLLEYAYEKVRTCIGSLEKFISEFPPIGIIYQHGEFKQEVEV